MYQLYSTSLSSSATTTKPVTQLHPSILFPLLSFADSPSAPPPPSQHDDEGGAPLSTSTTAASPLSPPPSSSPPPPSSPPCTLTMQVVPAIVMRTPAPFPGLSFARHAASTDPSSSSSSVSSTCPLSVTDCGMGRHLSPSTPRTPTPQPPSQGPHEPMRSHARRHSQTLLEVPIPIVPMAPRSPTPDSTLSSCSSSSSSSSSSCVPAHHAFGTAITALNTPSLSCTPNECRSPFLSTDGAGCDVEPVTGTSSLPSTVDCSAAAGAAARTTSSIGVPVAVAVTTSAASSVPGGVVDLCPDLFTHENGTAGATAASTVPTSSSSLPSNLLVLVDPTTAPVTVPIPMPSIPPAPVDVPLPVLVYSHGQTLVDTVTPSLAKLDRTVYDWSQVGDYATVFCEQLPAYDPTHANGTVRLCEAAHVHACPGHTWVNYTFHVKIHHWREDHVEGQQPLDPCTELLAMIPATEAVLKGSAPAPAPAATQSQPPASVEDGAARHDYNDHNVHNDDSELHLLHSAAAASDGVTSYEEEQEEREEEEQEDHDSVMSE